MTDLKKKCSRCRVPKPLRAFGINRSNNDGLSYVCKECHKSQKVSRAKENKKKWAKEDPYQGG